MNFLSMDGVIQSPLSPDEDRENGFAQGGWVPPYSDDTVNAFMEDATTSAAGMLLGRRSYEILRDAWSHADESIPAIAAMNRMPKYVVTSTPLDTVWENTRIVGDDLPRTVGMLTRQTDGDLVVFGAGALIRGLAEHDLIDQYRLLLFPVILGAGKRMFDDRAHPASFTLSDSIIAPSGVAILTFTRRREA